MAEIVEIRGPQIQEQVAEAFKVIPQERVSERVVVPQILEQSVEVMTVIRQEWGVGTHEGAGRGSATVPGTCCWSFQGDTAGAGVGTQAEKRSWRWGTTVLQSGGSVQEEGLTSGAGVAVDTFQEEGWLVSFEDDVICPSSVVEFQRVASIRQLE